MVGRSIHAACGRPSVGHMHARLLLRTYRNTALNAVDLVHRRGDGHAMEKLQEWTATELLKSTRSIKLEFDGTSFPRSILATSSPTSHEEIGHVGRVGRGCYEENCMVRPVEFQLNDSLTCAIICRPKNA